MGKASLRQFLSFSVVQSILLGDVRISENPQLEILTQTPIRENDGLRIGPKKSH